MVFIGLALVVLVASVARRGRSPAAAPVVEVAAEEVVTLDDVDFDQIEASIDEIDEFEDF